MKKLDGLKVLSIVTTLGGLALSFVTDVVNEKTMKKTIADEVQKALSDKK